MNKVLYLFLIGLISISNVMGAISADKVDSLPMCGPLLSEWYSGYLNVSSGKSLFYVFVQSHAAVGKTQNNDPLIIWFNGGPGCSSLLGLFTQNGPFVIDQFDTNIKQNPFPWTLNANVLYIESPAGVGFTRADTPRDKIHNDVTQSEDALVAIQAFFTGFPEYLTNDIYIAGESYAGIYVPYVAWQMHQLNAQNSWKGSTVYKLKGLIVGNGATDWNYDSNPSFPEVAYNYNLIPGSLLA